MSTASMRQKKNYDLIHETAFTPARQTKKTIPQVFTLHDLSLMNFKTYHPKERVWFFDLFFPRRLKYADHIITVSEFIKQEICEKLSISQSRVSAVHLACDPFFFPRPVHEVSRVKEKFNLPDNYLLFVGTLEPRKNLSLIIDAMPAIPEEIGLVLTGWSGWGDKDWMKRIKQNHLSHRVHMPGYVSENDLAALYSGAIAFVYPSFYEGFGLPVLEAMACKCPVITSNRASLPEVAGNAGILIDPNDHEALAHEITKIAEDSQLRESLISKGLLQASRFSWEKCARKTKQIFSEMI